MIIMPPIKNIREVTEPLKEEILKGTRRKSLSCVRVMSKVPSGNLCNAEMIVELFRPQLEHQTSYFSHQPSLRLYHHRDLIGSPSAFIKGQRPFLFFH